MPTFIWIALSVFMVVLGTLLWAFVIWFLFIDRSSDGPSGPWPDDSFGDRW